MALTQVKTAGIAADAVTGAKVADDQIDSEHYIAASIDNEHLANNAVDTDEIADDAVTLAKMDALARGKLIVGDSSGNPSALAAGSDNHVLTMDSNGDCGWEAASAGAALTGSTNNEVVTVTGANAMTGESGLTFDGTHLSITDGDLVIATSGHGIDFSATSDGTTMASELLDDYEEGEWEPTITDDGYTRTYNSTYTGGRYVKVGNTCTVQCCIYTSSYTGTFDGTRPYIGLPFSRQTVAGSMWWGITPLSLTYVDAAEIAKMPSIGLNANTSTSAACTYANPGGSDVSTTVPLDMDWHTPGNNYQVGFSMTYITQ
jgi:hypothetical protein